MSADESAPKTTRVARIIAVVALGGLAAGLVGAGLAWLLLEVQGLAYGLRADSLLADVVNSSPLRRVLAPTLAGLLVGLAWWWLRRPGDPQDVEDGIHKPGRMGLWRPLGDALLQILIVGAGASIGREGAPRQASAAAADRIAAEFHLDEHWSRAAIASAAGAGLAAVYNVPISGVVFAMELLLFWRPWRAVFLAVPMSVIGTVMAWPVVTNRPTYRFPAVVFDWTQIVWMLAAVPLTALLGAGFGWLARWTSGHRPRPGWKLPAAMALAGAVVGGLSVWLPMMPGNGKDLIQVAFDGQASLGIFVALMVLKPVATALCLGSGMKGGLLTPALSVGAALGTVAALTLPGGSQVPVFALLAAAGVLAVTQRAPVFGAVMAWELTHAPVWMLPMLLVVSFGAHWLVSRFGRGRGKSLPQNGSCMSA